MKTTEKADNPYRHIAPRGFWRSAVAEPGLYGLPELWKSQ